MAAYGGQLSRMVSGGSELYVPCTIPAPPFGGWRHHLPPLRGGTMGAGHFGQFAHGAAAAKKPYNRASPDGNAPLLPPSAASPRGEILAALCIVVLMGKSLLCGFILPPE